jgi:hypothetical protein
MLTPGLGDFIRGTITLLKLSKEMGFNVLVDLRYNPISNFLKTQDIDKLYLEKVDENLDNLKFFINRDILINYIIESFKNSDIITLHTNAITIENPSENFFSINSNINSLSEDIKNFIKNIFIPNDELQKYIDERMVNIPINYEIIHFRLGDQYSFESNNIPENKLVEFEELFKNNYNENTILLSDNKYFKNYIKSKYNIHIIDNEIEHLGDLNNNLNNNLDGVKGTLFDFFIQSNSKKIITFTIYHWISGFIYWSSLIYNIPFEARINI